MATTTQDQIATFDKSQLLNVQAPNTSVKIAAKTHLLWETAKHLQQKNSILQGTSPDGALYAIATPEQWNGGILIHCHGYRPLGSPFVVELPQTLQTYADGFFATMRKRGWIVAMTSYRRNGRIVKDAILDVQWLRQYIIDQVAGEMPAFVLLEGTPLNNINKIIGRSMGGQIVTRCAELPNANELFGAAIAIGAALYTREEGQKMPFVYTFQPKIPILYLTNMSETSVMEDYIANVKQHYEQDQSLFVPVQTEVWREGHDLVNEQERLNAVKNIFEWVPYDVYVVQKVEINTLPPKCTNTKSNAVWDEQNKGAFFKVIEVDPVYTDFTLNTTPKDLHDLWIKEGKPFTLITANNEEIEVHYGAFPFTDAKPNSFIAYEEPNFAHTTVTIFTYALNEPAKQAGVKLGDTVYIKKRY